MRKELILVKEEISFVFQLKDGCIQFSSDMMKTIDVTVIYGIVFNSMK